MGYIICLCIWDFKYYSVCNNVITYCKSDVQQMGINKKSNIIASRQNIKNVGLKMEKKLVMCVSLFN